MNKFKVGDRVIHNGKSRSIIGISDHGGVRYGTLYKLSKYKRSSWVFERFLKIDKQYYREQRIKKLLDE